MMSSGRPMPYMHHPLRHCGKPPRHLALSYYSILSCNQLAGCLRHGKETVLAAADDSVRGGSGDRPAQLIADVNPRLCHRPSVHFQHELGGTM